VVAESSYREDLVIAGQRQGSEFGRELMAGQIDALKKEPLFRDCLLPDIRSGVVLPTIRGRGSRVSFYYSGQKLFDYLSNGKFSTNLKFAFAADRQVDDPDYVTEDELRSIKPFETFVAGYRSIKENVRRYKGQERNALSALWKFSHAVDDAGDVVVLDIEVAFPRLRTKDMIDFVLFARESRKLTFFEGKRWEDGRLKAFGREDRGIAWQLGKYDEQLAKNEQLILEQYKHFTESMCALLDYQIPAPQSVALDVVLLVVEFEGKRDRRVREHIGLMREGEPVLMKNRRVRVRKNLSGMKPSHLRAWLQDRP
jgi:hypothetical protein